MSETASFPETLLPGYRRMPVPDAIRWLAEHGEPEDPRPDIDTASLNARFPRLTHVTTVDRTVEGPNGAIAVRVYRDPSAPAPQTALVWVHGGGFIGGSLDMPESNWVSRELAARGIPVIAVDYTKCLAGIHYPTPNHDVLAAWRFAAQHSLELTGVPTHSLLLGGASAGAGLSASTVTQLRDAGEALPAGLVLVYPVIHPNGAAPSSDIDPATPFGQLAMNYAGSTQAFTHPHAYAGVGTVEGFPPTLIVVCEHDTVRPSGEAFARALQNAGVRTALHLEIGADHAHIDQPGDLGAMNTIDVIAHFVRPELSAEAEQVQA